MTEFKPIKHAALLALSDDDLAEHLAHLKFQLREVSLKFDDLKSSSDHLTTDLIEERHADLSELYLTMQARLQDAQREAGVRYVKAERLKAADAVVPGQKEGEIKPAMAEPPGSATLNSGWPELSQGVPPVDRSAGKVEIKKWIAGRPLPTTLSIKLTLDLRQRIAAAAKADGRSDSAWLRHVALQKLGVESPLDAASGQRPRLPPDDLVALSTAVRALGECYAPLSEKPVNVTGVKDALGRARELLIPIITMMSKDVS